MSVAIWTHAGLLEQSLFLQLYSSVTMSVINYPEPTVGRMMVCAECNSVLVSQPKVLACIICPIIVEDDRDLCFLHSMLLCFITNLYTNKK